MLYKGDGGGLAITSSRHDLMMNDVISRRPWKAIWARLAVYTSSRRKGIKEKAVAAVEKELGPGWTVTLTDRRLTGQRLSKLGMRPNSVQKL